VQNLASPEPTPIKTAPSNPLKEALMDLEAQPQPGAGRRRGFMLVIILFVLALVTYVFSGVITGAVPALAPYIEGYTHMVDGLRAATQKLFGQ